MKFLVKHPGKCGIVFLSERYEGLTPDPVFSAKSDALEAYYEPFAQYEWGKDPKSFPKPTPVISQHGDVTRIEPPQ
jgi:hypothetical protein